MKNSNNAFVALYVFSFQGSLIYEFATKKPKLVKTGQNFAFYMLKSTPARKKVHHCHLWRLWLIWAMKVSMAFSDLLNSTPTPKALPHWFELFQTGSDWFRLVWTVSDWFELFQTGSDWFGLVQTGSDWFRLARTVSDWFRLVPTFSAWFGLVQAGSGKLFSGKIPTPTVVPSDQRHESLQVGCGSS